MCRLIGQKSLFFDREKIFVSGKHFTGSNENELLVMLVFFCCFAFFAFSLFFEYETSHFVKVSKSVEVNVFYTTSK